MASFKYFINKYPLLVFFALVFIISWSAIYILTGQSGFPVTEEQAVSLGMAILLGPSVSSILLTGLSSGITGYRELISRLFKWKVNIRWYVVAVLIAPISTITAIGILSLFSSEFYPNIFLSNEKTNLLIFSLIGGLTVGIFEEIGWTGFAIPRMKKSYGILGTGIVIGIIWGIWHFPLFWELNSFNSLLPFLLLLARLVSWLPPYRILMVWVYERTESLFLSILMHVSLVATLMILDPIVIGGGLLIFILMRAIILWGISAVVIHRK